MEIIWNTVNAWVGSVGMRPLYTKMASSAICTLALICSAGLFSSVLGFVSRRIIGAKVVSAAHKENVATFVRATTFFVFAWILSAYLPDVVKAFPSISTPASRVLDVIAVILCAAMFASAVTCLRSMAATKSKGHIFASKTFSQVVKILVWFTAAIVAVSALMGKSPMFVLSGLGALTAVLMLIFRDSLLGLVAGVQVSQNDMVRIGDWITMPKYNADGNVIDIALTTVKVQNFDNTVTMIPSSALISDAFVNWRYMSTSKGRRIKRPILISATSVFELSEEDRARLIGQGLLQESDRPVSNLAAFETWLRRMLASDESITKELTCMVRQTEAGGMGIPVEVYAFTKTRDWVEYERIQTDIFDRMFVTVPKFGLRVYQRPGDSVQ